MDSKTFIETLSGRLDFENEKVNELLYRFTGVLGDQLQQGDTVAIPAFGMFEPRKRLERISVHPSTGKKLLVPPKLIISFRPSGLLKQRIK